MFLPTSLLGCDGEEAPLEDAGRGRDASFVDSGPPPDFRGVSKGPFVQLLGPGRARLRFESRVEEPFAVRVGRAGVLPAG